MNDDRTTPAPDSPFRPDPGDRDAAPQFVLPLVVRIERAAPPARWELSDAAREAWRAAGFPLAVRTAGPADWPALTGGGLPTVRDAGFTEIAPGSCTVVADHPALR